MGGRGPGFFFSALWRPTLRFLGVINGIFPGSRRKMLS
jgi:hypothetical protein